MPVRLSFLSKKLFLPLLVCGLSLTSLAEETARTAPTPKPEAAPQVVPSPTPGKKKGFLKNIFQKGPTPPLYTTPTPKPSTPEPDTKKKPQKGDSTKSPTAPPAARDEDIPARPAPTSIPTPPPEDRTPSPTPRSTPEATLPETSAATEANASLGQLPDSLPPLDAPPIIKPLPADTVQQLPPPIDDAPPVVNTVAEPIPLAVRNNPLNQPIALIGEASASETISVPSPEAEQEIETLNRIQFRKVKAQALQDSKLQKLLQDTETAATPQERATGLKVYYQRLFASMRKIDPNLSVQIDELEAAARRRLDRLESDAPSAGTAK